MRILLASGSPRRMEILRGLGVDVTVNPVDIDETLLENETPSEYVLRLARRKVEALTEIPAGVAGLGADTIVILGTRILGKPEDEDDARAMLSDLSGRWHRVMTGLAVRTTDEIFTGYSITDVFMARMSPEEIDWYVSTEEPLDKAGAYGIQGHASLFIREIHGSCSNVIGLPVHAFYNLLKKAGLAEKFLADIPGGCG